MATDPGALRSENADMSNDKSGEIPLRRKSKDRLIFLYPVRRTHDQKLLGY